MDKSILRIFSLFTLVCFIFSFVVAPVSAAVNYTYDANGNMTSDGTKCSEYNEANQVKLVKNCSNNQTIAEYIYDHEGNRVVKKEYESGSLKRTVFSPNDEYETVKLASNSATQNTAYYHVNNELIAKKNPDGTKNYYHNDHLGSSSVTTNQSGNLVEQTTYDPWGEVTAGGTKSKYQYTGQEKDSETGLNYYGARYYDSHIRRFTQADDMISDPYNPQELNRYSYVNNNPIRYTDPTGHVFEDACLVECTAIYLSVVASAPDTQLDIQNLAQDASEFSANPSIGKGVAVGVSALSVAVPDASTGKSSRSVGQVVDKGINYYNNMTTMRRYEGRAGDNMHWGHFVEQNKTNIEQFGKQAIHNTLNVIRMPAKVNREMNKIYSSKQPGSSNTTREIINKKPYIDQFRFAVKTYKDVMNKYVKKK